MYTRHYFTTRSIAENETGSLPSFYLIFLRREKYIDINVVCQMVMSAEKKNTKKAWVIELGKEAI